MKNLVANSMKRTIRAGLVASIIVPLLDGCAQPQPAPIAVAPPPDQVISAGPEGAGAEMSAPTMAPAAAEVIRLAQAGVGEEVVLSYIQNSTTPFYLTADQILYLKDLGISSQVTTAMLNRDAMLRSQPQIAQGPPPAAEPPQPTVPVEAPLTPPPVEVASPPPQVNYFYSDLSPYGTWVDLEGFGWCWQPS